MAVFGCFPLRGHGVQDCETFGDFPVLGDVSKMGR